ncbi:MAG: hypothetical protein JNM84_17435 [Planctomycetes bacterium]|nr:hypothetical protein [Planctomycetota bacterium]
MSLASETSAPPLRRGLSLIAVVLGALGATGCVQWYAYDPAPHHGEGGFPPPEIEAPVPREGGLPIAPVALRYQGGTVDYRPAGSRGMHRLTFYENTGEVSPGAYVLSYSASRAQLQFGEGSQVILHNRCTALVEDATKTGSLLYLSALERVTADLDPAARLRLPGGALVGAAPQTAESAAPAESAPEGAAPAKPPGQEALPFSLLELLKAGGPGAGAGPLGALAAGGAEQAAQDGGEAPRLRFVATDFRAGRYVRVKNRGNLPLLVAHVSGDVTLGPGECVDFPVLRGLERASLPPTAALLASETAGGLRVRAGDGARLRVEGEAVEIEALGASGRAWASSTEIALEPGESARVRPLHGAPLAR